jgi:2-polyprenyl-3-methyl-5-hydroxy-6-metoxy-1,4-benzoquinol methylase
MTEKTLCPQCRSEDVSFLFSAKDHLVSGETYTIDRCRRCGVAFTVNPPSENEIHRYYVSEDYISHSDKKSNLADYFYHIARGLMLRKKYRLVTAATGKKTGTIIDIGSGTGYFASFIQKKGWTVTGIELNDRAREYSVSRFAINAVPPSELSGIDDKSVECITFWHVLEHLYDPDKWLAEVNRILKDEGKCLIALPNIDSADAGWFGDRWAALDVPRHLWHFSPEALVRFVHDHGFTCERVLPMPLDIFYISALGYKNSGRRLALARGLVAGLLLTAGSLFRKNSASSLIYILSKRQP